MICLSHDIPINTHEIPINIRQIPINTSEIPLIMQSSAMFHGFVFPKDQVRLLDGRRLRGASLPRQVPGTRSRREGREWEDSGR